MRNKSTDVKFIHNLHKPSCINNTATKTFVDQQKWDLFKLITVSQSPPYDRHQSYNPSEFVIKFDEENFEMQERKRHYSTFCASCFCVRKPSYYYLNAYFLILLITSTSLTIFSVNYQLPQNRLQTMFTLLLSSVSFKWVINRSLPVIFIKTPFFI